MNDTLGVGAWYKPRDAVKKAGERVKKTSKSVQKKVKHTVESAQKQFRKAVKTASKPGKFVRRSLKKDPWPWRIAALPVGLAYLGAHGAATAYKGFGGAFSGGSSGGGGIATGAREAARLATTPIRAVAGAAYYAAPYVPAALTAGTLALRAHSLVTGFRATSASLGSGYDFAPVNEPQKAGLGYLTPWLLGAGLAVVVFSEGKRR